MSKGTASPNFSGETDHFYDPNFTAEISQKMRVPKRINVDGVSDLPIMRPEYSSWDPPEQLDMRVPEKIVLTDQDGHYGTRTLPREITLDNAIMPPDPGIIKIQTPPRVLTIDATFSDEYQQPTPVYKEVKKHRHHESQLELVNRDSSLNESGTIAEGMTLNEEVVHLRRQLAKLNRRVMSIELENMQRQNRDKIIYALGLAYFFFKTVLWLSRS
ncbi:transport and golgi organization 11 isoform X2 [Rhodnius prolixus]|uniref:Putative transport and golgi organization n=2 Tax=Rhodnius TaxID=13248 RepID=R4FPW2_RHOPR